MKNVALILALILALLPATGFAGDPQVNPRTVDQCFASAQPGEVAPKCLGAASNACQTRPRGDTTIGISQCIMAETAEWDRLLNSAYQKLRAQYRKEGGDLPAMLLAAQRAWIAFRDAQCKLDYARWGDGSMRGIVAANCQMTMTAGRAIDLRDMEDAK